MNALRPAAVVVMAAAMFSVAAVAASEELQPEKASSAINRPEFKIRNLPYVADDARAGPSDGDARAPSEIPNPGVPQPTADEILSSVPEIPILKYIDQTDFEQRLTTQKMAEKYLLGALEPAAADTGNLSLLWLMMSDAQQRAAKLAWFRSTTSGVSLDDFNRVVDLRTYRVMTALNSIQTPTLRDVQPVIRVTYSEVEKLRMPSIKALSDWGDRPNPEFVAPTIRPVQIDPAAEGLNLLPIPILETRPERRDPTPPPVETASPPMFGIPSSLRNGP